MKNLFCFIFANAFGLYLLTQEQSNAQGSQPLQPGVYKEGKNGQLYSYTNIDIGSLWSGIWKEDTNKLRVELNCGTDNGQSWLFIGVGSIAFNSLGGYVGAPQDKFLKFELRDTNGFVVPFLKGASIESGLQARISVKELPRWPNGGLKNHIGFFTNSGPCKLADIKFNDLYLIPKDGDYTLTVCAAIYKWGTNNEYLDRMDLPTLSTKIHLAPAQ